MTWTEPFPPEAELAHRQVKDRLAHKYAGKARPPPVTVTDATVLDHCQLRMTEWEAAGVVPPDGVPVMRPSQPVAARYFRLLRMKLIGNTAALYCCACRSSQGAIIPSP